MAYCSISDVKDKSITDNLTRANWTDADIQPYIDEGGAVIDSYLLKVGYTQTNLSNAPLIKRINVLYTKYAILRDMFANVSPAKIEDKTFVQWKKEALDLLEKIQKGEIKLVDSSGSIIQNINNTIVPEINTKETARIFKMDEDYTWSKPDASYSDENVIGNR